MTDKKTRARIQFVSMVLQHKTRVTEEDRNNLSIKLVTQYEFPEFS